jgi:hypothetical protein
MPNASTMKFAEYCDDHRIVIASRGRNLVFGLTRKQQIPRAPNLALGMNKARAGGCVEVSRNVTIICKRL